jgi:ABC-type transporter Mla subunit MlaD
MRARERSRTATGALALLLAVAFTAGVLGGVIGPDMFAGGGRTVRAVFADAQQLRPGDEVRVQGVVEGSVTGIASGPGARSAVVTMSVAGSAGPLYRDATAVLRWKTLLGGAFYVELGRGSPAAGPLRGATIGLGHTGGQVELEDLLSVDRGAARRGLRTMLGQLATALSDPGAPASGLRTLASVAPFVSSGLAAVRGSEADADVRRLVRGTAATLRALNAPDGRLRGLVQGAAATLWVTAARAADLQAGLDLAPAALRQTRATLARLETTLGLAGPLLRSLVAPSGEVAPTVAALHPAVTGADRLLGTAVPLLRALPPALRSIASTARRGLPLLTGLTPSLDRLAGDVLPYLDQVDPASRHTTAEMIGPTLEALGPDITGQEDQNGHFIRFPATSGSSPFYLPCQLYAGNPTSASFLDCTALRTALAGFLGSGGGGRR